MGYRLVQREINVFLAISITVLSALILMTVLNVMKDTNSIPITNFVFNVLALKDAISVLTKESVDSV